jgi:hypothetical protein
VVNATASHFTPGKDPVTIVQQAVQGPLGVSDCGQGIIYNKYIAKQFLIPSNIMSAVLLIFKNICSCSNYHGFGHDEQKIIGKVFL